MIKKLTLLAMAVAAVVAFAAPAGASASGMYTMEGNPISEGGQAEEFSGRFAWSSPLGGLSCIGHVRTHITTNSASAESEITTSTCEGFGLFEGCEVVEDSFTVGNLTPTANAIDIEEFHLFQEYANCALSETTFIAANVTAAPDNTAGISVLTLSGSGNLITPLGTLPLSVSGSFEAANPGTFGVDG